MEINDNLSNLAELTLYMYVLPSYTERELQKLTIFYCNLTETSKFFHKYYLSKWSKFFMEINDDLSNLAELTLYMYVLPSYTERELQNFDHKIWYQTHPNP